MLEKELNYYITHQGELVREYNGQFLVIKDEKVIGAYPSKITAFDEAKEKYEAGSFLIIRCSVGSQDYTQTFHSRVSFAQWSIDRKLISIALLPKLLEY